MRQHRQRGFGEDAAIFDRANPASQHQLREVQASVAKTHFSQLLDEVERGQTIVILRHGQPIARIVPDEKGRQQRARQAIENIQKLGEQIRRETGGATIEEILAWRHEGHKY
jgi:prevent-host-death family protein